MQVLFFLQTFETKRMGFFFRYKINLIKYIKLMFVNVFFLFSLDTTFTQSNMFTTILNVIVQIHF